MLGLVSASSLKGYATTNLHNLNSMQKLLIQSTFSIVALTLRVWYHITRYTRVSPLAMTENTSVSIANMAAACQAAIARKSLIYFNSYITIY